MNPLICSVCQKELKKSAKQYACENKHTFDIAKEGYTNLLLKASQSSGDSKEMVNARRHFLEKDYYKQLRDTIINVVKELNPSIVVDAGCGEGYYTNEIANNLESNFYAFDMSKNALRYASKRSEKVGYFLSSIFHLPLQKQSIDIILNIFAPAAIEEFKRVLKENGYIIKVGPGKEHLLELKELLYDSVYLNEEKKIEEFNLISEYNVNYTMDLDETDVKNLLHMTPYLHRTPREKIEKLQINDTMQVKASFLIRIYQISK